MATVIPSHAAVSGSQRRMIQPTAAIPTRAAPTMSSAERTKFSSPLNALSYHSKRRAENRESGLARVFEKVTRAGRCLIVRLVSPNVFRFIGLLILVAGVIVSVSSGVGTGVPLYLIALVMFGLWWYQRRRLSRT